MMKKLFTKIGFSVLFFSLLFVSCKQGNRVKSSEELLKAKLQAEADSLALIKKQKEERRKKSRVLKQKEVRSIDPSNPPKIIDLTLEKEYTEFSLSNIGSTIKYIKLSIPGDSMFLSRSGEALLTENAIIVTTPFGLAQFSNKGMFQKFLCKTNIKMTRDFIYSDKEYFGNSGQMDIYEGKLYYPYYNYTEKNKKIFVVDLDERLNISQKQEVNSSWDNPVGELIMEANGDLSGYSRFLLLDENTYLEPKRAWGAAIGGVAMCVKNTHLDTVCQFTQFERLQKFNARAYRNGESLICAKVNNKSIIKFPYNDTVFKVSNYNQLVPEYVLKWGEYKTSLNEGINPRVSLKDKLLLDEWFEFDKYIFLTYSKNYICPNTVRNKEVDVYYAVYDKERNVLEHLKNEGKYPYKLHNDIDNGFNFFPKKQNDLGQYFGIINRRSMKKMLKPEDMNERQKQIYESIDDNEAILMMIN